MKISRLPRITMNFSVAMKGVGCVCLAVLLASAASAGQLDKKHPKFIHAEKILAPLGRGQTHTKVIISLVESEIKMTRDDWNSPRRRGEHQARVMDTQMAVIERFDNQQFRLGHRFENQAGFSAEVTSETLEKLLTDPLVVSIEPDLELQPHLAQGISVMAGMTYRGIYDGQGISIAVCDTGIDYNHPMFGEGSFPNSKVIGGYDIADNDADPFPDILGDDDAHGTCCAGIAAGTLGTFGDYIGGVAPAAKIIALKVKDSDKNIYNSYLTAAWDWCVSHKNDHPDYPILAVSNSVGGGKYTSAAECDSNNSALRTAAQNLVNAGITILASSGNDSYTNALNSPGCLSPVISVGSVYDTSPNTVPSYSNSASFLDLLAPSNNAYTTDIVGTPGYATGSYYAYFAGTSAACPYAAGAVAVLQSAVYNHQGRYLPPAEIRSLLAAHGIPVTDSKSGVTTPRVHLENVIDYVLFEMPAVAEFPYLQTFDSFSTCTTTCGVTCTLSEMWTNSVDDAHDWITDTGTTPTPNTGPTNDHTTGTTSGCYLYTESGWACSNADAVLLSPRFELDAMPFAMLSFWYHMYGSDMGSLTLQIFTPQQPAWQTIWQQSGNQVNQWLHAVIPLEQYGSTINLRFIGHTGNGRNSDMALDDIALYSDPSYYCTTPGDLQPDCAVNLADLTLMASYWLSANCDPVTGPANNCGNADLDAGGTVNLADFAILAANWLQ